MPTTNDDTNKVNSERVNTGKFGCLRCHCNNFKINGEIVASAHGNRQCDCGHNARNHSNVTN